MASVSEDRDEILQLMYRYNHSIDSGDADEWAGCFVEDAVFDGAGMVTTGRDALRAFAEQVGGRGKRHVLLNPLIDVDGDTAHGRAYVLLLDGPGIGAVGGYDDEFTRTADGWRIAKRSFTIDARAGAAA
jgi:ketosteroid isomerase-like protein